MRVYLGKQRNVASTGITTTCGTVLELVWLKELDAKYSWTIISPDRNFSVM
jgi:hypothetical protein